VRSIVLIILFFCGCTSTRIYDRGTLVAVIQGDATNVTVNNGNVAFHADTLNHSSATAAAYAGSSQVVGAVGSAVASGLLAVP
jgi:hypothetical protein